MSPTNDPKDRKQKLTEDFLKQVGLETIPQDQKDEFMKQVQQTLQLRVGQQIAQHLTEVDLKQFQTYMSNKQPQQAMEFLHQKVPSHSQIVQTEMTKLQNEIQADAGKILDSFRQSS